MDLFSTLQVLHTFVVFEKKLSIDTWIKKKRQSSIWPEIMKFHFRDPSPRCYVGHRPEHWASRRGELTEVDRIMKRAGPQSAEKEKPALPSKDLF